MLLASARARILKEGWREEGRERMAVTPPEEHELADAFSRVSFLATKLEGGNWADKRLYFYGYGANASLEAYLRTHRHGGSCGSQRICTHDFLAPHISGPRDVPPLSLLQKTPYYRGGRQNWC
jgi:hypothetical protein